MGILISWQNSGMIIERRRELEFNTEAGRAAGILEIGEARDISNPGEPPQLSGPLAPAHHRRGKKVKEREKENVKPRLEKCCLHAMLASGMRDFA